VVSAAAFFLSLREAIARSRRPGMSEVTPGAADGFGSPGKMVISPSFATHSSAALQCAQRSSGAVANFSTSKCSPTSIQCGDVVLHAPHVYGSASASTWPFGPRSSFPHSFSRNGGITPTM
jgi:hypothetical protein